MFQIAHKLSLGWTTRAAAVSYFDRVLQDLRDMPMNGKGLSQSSRQLFLRRWPFVSCFCPC